MQTKTDTFAKSVDPDEMAHNDLHCLPVCFWLLTGTPIWNSEQVQIQSWKKPLQKLEMKGLRIWSAGFTIRNIVLPLKLTRPGKIYIYDNKTAAYYQFYNSNAFQDFVTFKYILIPGKLRTKNCTMGLWITNLTFNPFIHVYLDKYLCQQWRSLWDGSMSCHIRM